MVGIIPTPVEWKVHIAPANPAAYDNGQCIWIVGLQSLWVKWMLVPASVTTVMVPGAYCSQGAGTYCHSWGAEWQASTVLMRSDKTGDGVISLVGVGQGCHPNASNAMFALLRGSVRHLCSC